MGQTGPDKGKGGKLTAAPASPVKSAYSVSVCNHCGERGHKKADCRNLAQPSGGCGQGGGKHVALAYKNLSLEEYRKLVANQRP